MVFKKKVVEALKAPEKGVAGSKAPVTKKVETKIPKNAEEALGDIDAGQLDAELGAGVPETFKAPSKRTKAVVVDQEEPVKSAPASAPAVEVLKAAEKATVIPVVAVPGVPAASPVIPVVEKKAVVNPLEIETNGELTFSNRTHFELVFSDLGFEAQNGSFDPLVILPYSVRDLEKEGFTKQQVVKSKNIRNFIASGKLMWGVMSEADKLPENTKFAAVRNLGAEAAAKVKFSGQYFDKWEKFVALERSRFERGVD